MQKTSNKNCVDHDFHIVNTDVPMEMWGIQRYSLPSPEITSNHVIWTTKTGSDATARTLADDPQMFYMRQHSLHNATSRTLPIIANGGHSCITRYGCEEATQTPCERYYQMYCFRGESQLTGQQLVPPVERERYACRTSNVKHFAPQA